MTSNRWTCGSVALLYSGGVDSFIAYTYLTYKGYDVYPVHFRLGSRYDAAETWAIDRQFGGLPILTMDNIHLGAFERSVEENAFIPGRNLFLILGALACFPKCEYVCLPAQKGESNVSDKDEEFFDLATPLIGHLAETTLMNPFADMTKVDCVNWYVDRHPADKDRLWSTFSCYKPIPHDCATGSELSLDYVDEVPCWWLECGDCPACFRKAVAFAVAGLMDQPRSWLHWKDNPLTSQTARLYEGRLSQYDSERQKNIKKALEIGARL